MDRWLCLLRLLECIKRRERFTEATVLIIGTRPLDNSDGVLRVAEHQLCVHVLRGYSFGVAITGHQKEQHDFLGPLQNTHTHTHNA